MGMDSIIVLIGVPRSGKTTLGRRMAAELKTAFFDLDELVLEKFRMESLATLVRRYGEATLRKAEQEILSSTKLPTGSILALGGGSVLGEYSLRELIPHGIFVHFTIPFAIFLERILPKPLPATCSVEKGWYLGLKEFYETRYGACSQLADRTIVTTDFNVPTVSIWELQCDSFKSKQVMRNQHLFG